MGKENPIVVKHLPARLNLGQIQEFLTEIEPVLKSDQPHIVFDFSHVRHMDSAGVEMLLHCMEETTKRDGDLKLAAVPPELSVILELTRVDRLFEIFESSEAAVESFEGFSPHGRIVPQISSSKPPSPAGGGHNGKSNGHFNLSQ
jgi:anti-sigma B factor antagonist